MYILNNLDIWQGSWIPLQIQVFTLSCSTSISLGTSYGHLLPTTKTVLTLGSPVKPALAPGDPGSSEAQRAFCSRPFSTHCSGVSPVFPCHLWYGIFLGHGTRTVSCTADWSIPASKGCSLRSSSQSYLAGVNGADGKLGSSIKKKMRENEYCKETQERGTDLMSIW